MNFDATSRYEGGPPSYRADSMEGMSKFHIFLKNNCREEGSRGWLGLGFCM